MNKAKYKLYFIFFIIVSKIVLSQGNPSNISPLQQFISLNDSLLLKKELFETVTHGANKSLYKFPMSTDNAFELMALEKNEDCKQVLEKYFSKYNISILLRYEIYDRDAIFTDWHDVFENHQPDSITFIWQRHIDDFYYIQDSLAYIAGMQHKEFKHLFLWYIAPSIIMVTDNKKTKTYAFVLSYKMDRYANVPYHINVDLYEKKKDKWEVVEHLYSR